MLSPYREMILHGTYSCLCFRYSSSNRWTIGVAIGSVLINNCNTGANARYCIIMFSLQGGIQLIFLPALPGVESCTSRIHLRLVNSTGKSFLLIINLSQCQSLPSDLVA
ncbi:hypothetical protein [Crucivirus-416]|nr:hypothetical protein [Crucivirus-416]